MKSSKTLPHLPSTFKPHEGWVVFERHKEEAAIEIPESVSESTEGTIVCSSVEGLSIGTVIGFDPMNIVPVNWISEFPPNIYLIHENNIIYRYDSDV